MRDSYGMIDKMRGTLIRSMGVVALSPNLHFHGREKSGQRSPRHIGEGGERGD